MRNNSAQTDLIKPRLLYIETSNSNPLSFDNFNLVILETGLPKSIVYLEIFASVLSTTPSPASSSFSPLFHDTSTDNWDLDNSATTKEPMQGWLLLTRNFIFQRRNSNDSVESWIVWEKQSRNCK
jgi:hypothetical protein